MDTLKQIRGKVGIDIDACDDKTAQAIVRVITSDSCEVSCSKSCASNVQCKLAVFDATNRKCVHTNVERPLSVKDAYHTAEPHPDVVTFVKSTCNKRCKSGAVDGGLVVAGACTRWMTDPDGECEDEMPTGTSAPPIDCRACATEGHEVASLDCDAHCDAREPPLHGKAGECPDVLESGKVCAPYCDPGYRRSGLTKCVDGRLEKAACVPNHCAVTPPGNGDLGACPDKLGHGESCAPTCHDGYELKGRTTCYAGKIHHAECAPVACEDLELPEGATRGNCPETLGHGQSCEPACPDGTELSQPLACSSGKVTPAVCAPKHCRIAPPAHGTLGTCPSQLRHGESCEIACSDGYAARQTTVTCHYGKADCASCDPIGCDITPHVLDPSFDPKMLEDALMRSGSTLAPTCRSGHEPSGVFQCDNGALSETAACLPKSCTMRVPLHASIGQCGATLNHGETCDLSCAPGYERKGTTTCNAGTLTTARCDPMVCPDVDIPPNARHRGDCPTKMEHGASCTPACEAGTTLTSKTKCDQGALKLGVCAPDACDMELPAGHAGMGNCHGTLQHGDHCTPDCLDGHELSHDTTCKRGKLTVGTCEPRSCAITPATLPRLATPGKCPRTLPHGEACTPDCASGYTIDGPIECVFGSLRTGECVPDSCDGLVVPDHGMAGTCRSELAHEEACQMACDAGYTISGNTTCTFGVVSNAQCTPNSCAVPSAIEHGTMGDCPATLPHGRTCKPRCEPGYELDRPLSCQLGELTASTCVARACSHVTPPLHAASNGDCGDELDHGESCSPECDVGYTIHGKTECSKGTLIKAECRPDDCHGIRAPVNGSLGDCTETLAHGKVCTPACEVGYTSASGPILCNAGALSDTPRCTPKSCHIAAPPVHGTMGTCKKELAHSETCRPECKRGYTLSREMSCSAGLLTTAVCTEEGCPVEAPSNGAMGACPATLAHGESCRPTCDPGYSLVNETSCHLGVSTPSLCLPDACHVSAPANGDLGTCAATMEHGSTCEPVCDDGYALDGAMSCFAGELTKVARCVPKSCDMTPPVNGKMGSCPSKLADGQTCEPVCLDGFSLDIATSCTKGILDKSSCLPVHCTVSPPDDGNMGECDIELLHGESCRPGCSDGYTLEGQLTCAKGVFTQVARCVPKPCRIDDDSTCDEKSRFVPHGDSYKPTCPPGFVLSGGPLTCNAGTFSGSYECIPASCDVTPPVNGTLGTCVPNPNCDKGTGRLAHGEYCSFQCNPGYTIDGDSSIGCVYGKVDGVSTCKLTACDLRYLTVENSDESARPAHIEHGATYAPKCDIGFTMDGGPFLCKMGKLEGVAQCKPDACSVYPPLNGALGSCKSTLKHAESCMPTCDDGFDVLGGPLTCNAGRLSGMFSCLPRATVDDVSSTCNVGAG